MLIKTKSSYESFEKNENIKNIKNVVQENGL